MEIAEQVAILERLGCDSVQGYHFSQAVRLSEFVALVTGDIDKHGADSIERDDRRLPVRP